MLLQALALLALVASLWVLFRFAMGLRASKLAREQARAAAEAKGARVVAEVPLAEGLLFVVEDAVGFSWGARQVAKDQIEGVRQLLNGALVASFSRPGASLPEPAMPEPVEGRERWEVAIHLRDGRTAAVPCGTLREGVSREIAARVYAAVRGAIERPRSS